MTDRDEPCAVDRKGFRAQRAWAVTIERDAQVACPGEGAHRTGHRVPGHTAERTAPNEPCRTKEPSCLPN